MKKILTCAAILACAACTTPKGMVSADAVLPSTRALMPFAKEAIAASALLTPVQKTNLNAEADALIATLETAAAQQ